jgi:glycerol-3-phosphate dehydrogenase
MAHDAIDAAVREASLTARSDGARHPTLGAPPPGNGRLEENILSGKPLDADDGREIQRIACDEMARTVEDVLARRTRALFLDARCAADAAPSVADVLARALGRDTSWIDQQVETFTALAARHLPGN